MEPSAAEAGAVGGEPVSFLLDTDICSAYLKGNSQVWQKVMQHAGQLHVSTITVGELFTWASRQDASPKRRESLEAFLQDVTVLDVTRAIAERLGELRAVCFDTGRATPDMDLIIAATATVHDLTLVTHNVQDFADVQGLRIQDWLCA
ncbi:MAG: type II toxin-antitoxin system VapC family toxin [Pirellulales bacterium]